VRRFGGAQFSEEGKMTNDEMRAVEVLREEINGRRVDLDGACTTADADELLECVKLAGFELRK
jgi:hypothetical protein